MIKALFSTKGRIGRLQYFLTSLGITLGVPLIVCLIGAAVQLVMKMNRVLGILELLMIAGLILYVILLHRVIVKRLHDMDRPASHFWAILLPIYNIYFAFILLLRKGTDGDNQYGPDPLHMKA